ncbi:hypothetical protein [Streptomyces sp. NPDC003032]
MTHLYIRGQFPAIDYPFRRDDRDSIRVAMSQGPADIAARIAAALILVHREVQKRVTEHNARDSRHPMGSGSDVR